MLLHPLNQAKENTMKKNKNLRRVLISLLVLTTVFVSAFSFAYADSSSDTSVTATSTSQGQPGNPPSGDPPSGGPGGQGGTPPEKPDGDSSGGPGGTPPDGAPGGPGGSSSADISYTGNTEFTDDTAESGQTYTSDESNVQALLASGGTSSIDKATVTKTGDSDGDESDFYGTNAAVL